MKIKVASDIHFFGVDPVKDVEFDDLNGCILLGDILDLKNVLPEFHENCKYLRDRYLDMCGIHYITGNHECYSLNLHLHLPDVNGKRVDLIHGDIPLWGLSKAIGRRNVKGGCGRFLRFFKWIGSKYRNVVGCKLKDKEKRELIKYCPDSDVIIIGHKHPKKIIDEIYNGVGLIVVPRGITEIEI